MATVRAALSEAITNDVDKADRLDVLEGCHHVLGDAMDSMWTAWVRFDQGQVRAQKRRGGPEGTAQNRNTPPGCDNLAPSEAGC